MEYRALEKFTVRILVAVLIVLLALGGASLSHVESARGSVSQSSGLMAALSADVTAKAQEKAAEKRAWNKYQLKMKIKRKTVSDGLYNIGSVSKSSLSLSVDGGSKRNGAKTVPAGWNGSDWAQKWAVSWDAKTGYYKIRNLNSRQYLSVSGKVKAGAATKQVSAAKTVAQLWEPVKVSGGVMFKSAGSKLALATVVKGKAVSFKLQKATTKVTAAQKFKLRAVDPIEANYTYVVTSVSTGKRLHVAGNSKSDGANLDLAAAANTKSQKFRLTKSGSACRLQNVGSCYYAGTNAKGAAAKQLSSSAGNQSKWQLKFDCKAAAFGIVSPVSGRYLDATSGKLSLKAESYAAPQLFTFARAYAFKVYLNPGHGWNSNGNGVWDPGAIGSGYQEATFTHDLARRVESCLAGSDIQVVNGERYGLAYWNRLPKAVSLGCDAIVSLHFDAGGGSGTLKMVGTHGRASGSYELANAIHAGVVSNLHLPDRGMSWRSDITCVNGPIPSMLTEVCYMDNWHDVSTYLGRRDAVARGIANGIQAASRSRAIVIRTASAAVEPASAATSIASAKTTRNVVWSGATSVSLTSVTVSGKTLQEKRDFTKACYTNFKRYSTSKYEVDDEGRVIERRGNSDVPVDEEGVGQGEGESDSDSGEGDAVEKGDPVVPPVKVIDANPVIYQNGSFIYTGVKVAANAKLAANTSYTMVLLGRGSYGGIHSFTFQPHKTIDASKLRQGSGYYKYTGKAIVPRYYVGSAAAADREFMPASNYALTLSKHLFSTVTPTKKAVAYANYRYNEWYAGKVTGKKGGKLKGSHSFNFRIYRPIDISKCVMTKKVPLTRVGDAAEFSIWYPKAKNYGDYVPGFLYTVSYRNSSGKKLSGLPAKTGTYKLVIEGNASYGCKGKLTRTVKFSKSTKDIGSGKLAVKIAEEPSKATNYRPSFKVVSKSTGKVLDKKYYTVRYINNLDQPVQNLKNKGAIVLEGKNGYTGHLIYYIGQP